MKTFYKLLGSALLVGTVNNFIWFALTFWIYIETDSVVSTGILGGLYLVITALCGFWFGAIVDHHKKKHAMLGAVVASLVLYILGFMLYTNTPQELFTSVSSPILWVFATVLLAGAIAGNIFNIAIPTLVTILVPEDKHDKANGMFGTVSGIGFALTSIASGLILSRGGMGWVLMTAIGLMILALLYLLFISIAEKKIVHVQDAPKKIDIKGTIKVIKGVPGLFPLLFFATFNNFLGGAFMALMDAYGLSLVSVEAWGILLAVLSFGFIFGGLYVSKKGLGKNPLKTLFMANIAAWVVCIFFVIQPSIILLALGMIVWMSLSPFMEAAEQTIIQKVVPQERQGRVFGFAQSMEQAASPLTAFLIGPIAQFMFIPLMIDGGMGAELIGSWFGTGVGRGIALVFIATGFVGLVVTIFSMRTNAYRLLSKRYLE